MKVDLGPWRRIPVDDAVQRWAVASGEPGIRAYQRDLPLVTESDSSLLSGTHEAVFSPDRTYRYLLVRWWGDAPSMAWVMLNPSTADAFADDPTIRRCMKFARREGCGGITVVNLFALRSADPRVLRHHPDPVGASNDTVIGMNVGRDSPVVAAWGTGGTLNGRDREVAGQLKATGIALKCFGVTRDGHPKHPLARGRERIPDDAPLIPWEAPS